MTTDAPVSVLATAFLATALMLPATIAAQHGGHGHHGGHHTGGHHGSHHVRHVHGYGHGNSVHHVGTRYLYRRDASCSYAPYYGSGYRYRLIVRSPAEATAKTDRAEAGRREGHENLRERSASDLRRRPARAATHEEPEVKGSGALRLPLVSTREAPEVLPPTGKIEPRVPEKKLAKSLGSPPPGSNRPTADSRRKEK